MVFFRQKYLTQREIDEVYKREMLDGGVEYPNQLLVIVICFTYACISPIILPIGSIYFLTALVVYKNQILLIYAPDYEGGGIMVSQLIAMIISTLSGSSLTLNSYFPFSFQLHVTVHWLALS